MERKKTDKCVVCLKVKMYEELANHTFSCALENEVNADQLEEFVKNRKHRRTESFYSDSSSKRFCAILKEQAAKQRLSRTFGGGNSQILENNTPPPTASQAANTSTNSTKSNRLAFDVDQLFDDEPFDNEEDKVVDDETSSGQTTSEEENSSNNSRKKSMRTKTSSPYGNIFDQSMEAKGSLSVQLIIAVNNTYTMVRRIT
jgi:hypothetical protein